MLRHHITSLGALALMVAVHNPLGAQGTQPVQLSFGYECGDRFLVRNDGTQPVVVEYGIAGSQDLSQLHLNGKQQAEIASAQRGTLDLWLNGKVVGSAAKGDQACGSASLNDGSVVVRPLTESDGSMSTTAQATITPQATYSAPPAVTLVEPPYYYPNPYPYAYYGYGPYYYPSISFYGGMGPVFRGGMFFRGRGRI